jgi:uncharacterized membrane protein (DUF2068 family)
MFGLKLTAGVLGVYGSLNLMGSVFANLFGIPRTGQIGIAVVGFFLIVSAFGLWHRRKWAGLVAIVSMAAMSGLVYYTEYTLYGPSDISLVRHLIQGGIGAAVIAVIIVHWKQLT